MVKVPKFGPIGEFLSVEDALLQASRILDSAGMMAQRNNDVEGMANIGALYIELADKLAAVSENSDIDEEALAKKQPLGYVPYVPPVVVPTVDTENEDERTDGEGEEEARSYLQPYSDQQPRQLRVKQGDRWPRIRR